MGLDSCVKKYLRDHASKAFHYHKDLKSVYAQKYDALIIDMNVELFRKPESARTGLGMYHLVTIHWIAAINNFYFDSIRLGHLCL